MGAFHTLCVSPFLHFHSRGEEIEATSWWLSFCPHDHVSTTTGLVLLSSFVSEVILSRLVLFEKQSERKKERKQNSRVVVFMFLQISKPTKSKIKQKDSHDHLQFNSSWDLTIEGLSQQPQNGSWQPPSQEAAIPEGSSGPRCLFWETRESVNNILHHELDYSIPLFFHVLYPASSEALQELPGNESG